MSNIKWPTDVGEVVLEVIENAWDDNVHNNSLGSAFAEIKQFVIDKTTWRAHELNCQATVNFTATVKVPPGTDFDDDFVISEIVQQMDSYVDVHASCNDDELDEGCVLTDITDEEIHDFILADAT